jgi:hypothetical protein
VAEKELTLAADALRQALMDGPKNPVHQTRLANALTGLARLRLSGKPADAAGLCQEALALQKAALESGAGGWETRLRQAETLDLAAQALIQSGAAKEGEARRAEARRDFDQLAKEAPGLRAIAAARERLSKPAK